FASPPDPSWIAGIYDGADGDDIVSLVYETAGVEAASTGPVPPLPRSSEIPTVSTPSTIHGLPACQFTRGPPVPPPLIFYGVRPGLQFPARFPAYSVTQRHSADRLERVSQTIKAQMSEGRFPGAVVLIARKGKIGYFEAFGQQDPATGVPMSKDAI